MIKLCAWDECSNQTDNPKFCSLSCAAYSQRSIRSSSISYKDCRQCTNVFTVSRRNKSSKFCSRSCSARFNNAGKFKHGRNIIGHPCIQCSSPVHNNYAKYCSTICDLKHRRTEKIRKWLSGEWVPKSETGIPHVIRKFLLEEANNRCSSPSCSVLGGWGVVSPFTGKSPLTIDHIDGNAFNNSPDNLRVLCPNCHSLTPTYGALNRGSGRTYRYNPIDVTK